MTDVTYSAYWAFYLYLLLLLVQWCVATFSKARQPSAIPGKIDSELSHGSFVFRAHRTFQNSLENSALFMGAAIFAFSISFYSAVFAICMWIYLAARIMHMVLYYAIATEKNPSPRSYFFLLGFAANVAMLILLGIKIIG